MDLGGASFNSSRAVLVFEQKDEDEERLTVLHEISHILDPGWEHAELGIALREDVGTLREALRKRLTREISPHDEPLESFAELAAWEMAGVKELKYLPRAREVVRKALYWEN